MLSPPAPLGRVEAQIGVDLALEPGQKPRRASAVVRLASCVAWSV
jgi:hypothetical protein